MCIYVTDGIHYERLKYLSHFQLLYSHTSTQILKLTIFFSIIRNSFNTELTASVSILGWFSFICKNWPKISLLLFYPFGSFNVFGTRVLWKLVKRATIRYVPHEKINWKCRATIFRTRLCLWKNQFWKLNTTLATCPSTARYFYLRWYSRTCYGIIRSLLYLPSSNELESIGTNNTVPLSIRNLESVALGFSLRIESGIG